MRLSSAAGWPKRSPGRATSPVTRSGGGPRAFSVLRAPGRVAALALAAVTALLGAGQSVAQTATAKPERAPRPAWVEPAEMPAPRAERLGETSGGEYYLLFDTQIRVEGDRIANYSRIAIKVLDPAGLKTLGRLSFNFDPQSSRLVLHAITIRRDGELLDRLAPEAFQVIRQEPELYDGMILGDLTAFTNIPDLRVGDVLDYEWSLVSDWSLWPGGLAGYFTFDFSVPLEDRRLRVLTPADMPLRFAARGLDLAPETRRIGAETERVWRRQDARPIDKEKNVPATVVQTGFIELSSMQTWREVADWGRNVADVDMTLPDGAMAKALGGNGDGLSVAEKVSRIIRFVQDDIRYVGDEVGLGSHVPRTPRRALELGYGDCKDKSLLLVAYLRALGFEATPALANGRKGRKLPEMLPSPFAFDHMILRVIEGGREVWIDPTWTHQGGLFPDFVAPDLGYALPLAAGQADLAPIRLAARPKPTVDLIETFDFGDLSGKGLGLSVETTYRGREADWFRRKLVREARTDLEGDYFDYYEDLYPGLEIESVLSVSDNREANEIVAREQYRMPADAFFAGDWRKNLPIKAEAVRGLVEMVEPADRRLPVALDHPLDRLHRHRFINLPEVFAPVHKRLETEAFVFSQSSRARRDFFEIEYILKSRARSVASANFSEHNAFAEQIEDATYFTYSFMDKERGGGAPGQAQVVSAWFTEQFGVDPVSYEFLAIGSALSMVFGVSALLVYLSIRADRPLRRQSLLYPVSVWKFVALSLLTMGAYPLLWMWKNWLWVKTRSDASIRPFLRTLFAPLFIFALGSRIRGYLPTGTALPRVLAICGLLYLVLNAVGLLTEWDTDDVTITALISDAGLVGVMTPNRIYWALSVVTSLLLVPFVVAINGVNADVPERVEAMHRHSRWSYRSVIGAAGGLLLSAVMLVP